MSAESCGAPGAYTDCGPPDSTIAAGLRANISSTEVVCGTISEYTRASRTRRAISWAYWAPKSTTRTRSCVSAVTGTFRCARREGTRRVYRRRPGADDPGQFVRDGPVTPPAGPR